MAKPSSSPKDQLSKYSSPQRFSRFGYLVILLIFGALGGWAAFAKIDSATVAHGTVELEGNRKVVQHLSGGIVKTLHVREADSVGLGDVLVTLESVEARANLDRLETRLVEARVTEARLRAELDFADEISLPEDLDVDGAALASFLGVQKDILADRLAIYSSRYDVLKFRLEQLEAKREGLDQQRDALEQRVTLHQELVDRLTAGEASGAVQRNRLSERRDMLIQIKASLGEVSAARAQAGVAVSEAQLNLMQASQEFQERANLELNEVMTRISELEETITVARDTFERTEIRSPADGVVQALSVTTEGSVIRPGETLMEIVPENGKLLIAARVAPLDIDNVLPGQKSEVRLVAFKTKLTPILLGTVETVSRDVITPERTGEQPYYLARVKVPEENMSDEVREGLTPGMPADVVIVNGERSVLSYLASPLTDAIAKSFKEQ